jgi:hypothetical protein
VAHTEDSRQQILKKRMNVDKKKSEVDAVLQKEVVLKDGVLEMEYQAYSGFISVNILNKFHTLVEQNVEHQMYFTVN